MVILYRLRPAPKKPAGAEPVLSVAQVWEAYSIKVRQPDLFVEPTASAIILKESETAIMREIYTREV